MALDAGGAVSGEHGIGTEKMPYFLEMAGPVAARADAGDQDRTSTRRHPGPGPGARRTCGQERRHERCPCPPLDAGRRRRRRVLRQSRHLGDALRRRARRRARHAGRPVPLRGSGHRRRRRLRPGGRTSRGHAAAPRTRDSATGWPTCTMPGGPARRSSTSWATTPRTTLATTRRSQSDIASIAGTVSGWYRSTARADDVAGDAADAVAAAIGPPGLCRHPGLAGGRLVVRVVDRSMPAAAASRRRTVVPADTVDEVAKALRSGERAALLLGGGRCAPTACTRPAGSPPRPVPRCWARRSRPTWSGAPASRPSNASAYLAEMAQAQLDGVRHLFSSTPRPGVVLRLPRQGQRPRARRLHGAHAGPTGRGCGRGARGPGRGGRRPGRRRRAGRSARARTARRVR